MILIDSNIPMYLVGAEHPLKGESRKLLEEAIRREERLVTDVEVLQEILHRYSAIARLDAVEPAFAALLNVVDEVFPIDRTDLEEAKHLLLAGQGVSARDAIHVAVMRRHGVERILSFDGGFDGIAGISRYRG